MLTLKEETLSAIRDGNLEKLKKVHTFYGLFTALGDGYDLLCETLKYSHASIAKWLIVNGARVYNNPADKGMTPLHLAVIIEDLELVQLLLNKGCNVNAKNERQVIQKEAKGETVLNSQYFEVDESFSLLHQWTPAHKVGKTPLLFSLSPLKIDICKLLLASGASVEDPDLLISAVKEESLEVVELLLEYGANPNALDANDKYEETPLHYTSGYTNNMQVDFYKTFCNYNGQLQGKIAELLLSKNANVNAVTSDGETPLHYACRGGREKVVAALLKYNANCNVKDRNGTPPLYWAAKNGNEKIVIFLLNNVADIDVTCTISFNTYTPLLIACKNGHAKVVKVLLMCGANVNKTSSGVSALHFAVQIGHPEIVKVLLQHGAKVNRRRKGNGLTPIHDAVVSNSHEIVEILGKAGANVNIKDWWGFTPLHSAVMLNYIPTFASLIKYGADINDHKYRGNTALYAAIGEGPLGILQFLLDHGADINVINKKGETPLAYAYDRATSICGENISWVAETDNSKVKTLFKDRVFTLVRDIIIKQSVGFHVCHENFLTIAGSRMMQKYYFECVMEMDNIKLSKITNTRISVFDILTKKLSKVAKFVRNTNVERLFFTEASKEYFPLYANDIAKQIKRGQCRNELIENVEMVLSSLREFCELPDICKEKIFDYIDTKDIQEFGTEGDLGVQPTLLKPYF